MRLRITYNKHGFLLLEFSADVDNGGSAEAAFRWTTKDTKTIRDTKALNLKATGSFSCPPKAAFVRFRVQPRRGL